MVRGGLEFVSENSIQELSNLMTEIRIELGRMGEKIDSLTTMRNKVETIDDTAKEALQSTRAAHKRLDEINQVIDKKIETLKRDEIHPIKEQQTWLMRLIVGAFLTQLVALIFILARGGLGQ